MPVIVYGAKFWKKVLNWEYLAETGMINKEDLNLFHFCDSVDEAYKIITETLEKRATEKK